MIAIGFLVSYDFELLKVSLPLVYPHAAKIILALDAGRKTLTGRTFAYDEDFRHWVEAFDTEKKITWLEKDFYIAGKTPFETVMAERNLLLETMKPADWFVQLDADEYFIGFEKFVPYLNGLPLVPESKKSISVKWKTIFKQVKNGYLVIAGREERIEVATNVPLYTSERHCKENTATDSDFFMLHQSWARSEEEIKTKVQNWSHAHDFNTAAFYDLWLACNQENYKRYINFHPLHGPIWPRLEFVKADSVDALIQHYTLHPPGEEKPNPTPVVQLLKSRVKKWLFSADN